MNVPENKLIDVCLGQAATLFDGNYPQIIRTAVKHNYGSILGKLLNDAFFYERKGIAEPLVIEALLSLALLHCSNRYCFVMHSLRLSHFDLNSKEVISLFDSMNFPETVAESEKWSEVLRITFDLFKNKTESYCKNIDAVSVLLSKDEFLHYRNILALIAFLEFLSHFYHKEVFIENESTIAMYKKEVDVYIKYYEEYKSKNKNDLRLPVLVICSYCNALKDNNGTWHHVLDILPSIPLNATFTHSICDKCLSKATEEAKSSLSKSNTYWLKRMKNELTANGISHFLKRYLP